MRIFPVIFLLILSLAKAGHGQTDDDKTKKQVMMQMLRLRDALVMKDSLMLDKLLAGDASYGHSNGMLQSKSQLIRSVVSHEQDYKTIDPSDMIVRAYGDAAIVTTKLHVVMSYQNEPIDMNMNATLSWVRMNGDWKLVARQSVKL